MKFDQMGELKSIYTKKDIYDLGRHNPIIGAIVNAHEHGSIDWPSALAIMVFELAKANEERTKILVRHMELCTAPVFGGLCKHGVDAATCGQTHFPDYEMEEQIKAQKLLIKIFNYADRQVRK